METRTLNPDKSVAALTHIAAFTKYFIPFGNFIFPLILWTAKKNDPFVDAHGRESLNFQISMFLYLILLVCVTIAGILFLGINLSLSDPTIFSDHFEGFNNISQAIPLIIFIGIIGILFLALFIFEIVAVISATIKANEGQFYKYPFTINFITSTPVDHHQSKNEQFNNTQNQTL